MSSFPPPTGRPATMFPRPDPWVEQARRQEQHRVERRRRRRRWLLPLVALVVLAVLAVAGFLVISMLVDGGAAEPVVTVEPAPSVVPVASPPEPTVPPDRLVEIDHVWLVDRGDGVFDWGVSLRTPPETPTRRGVVIDVRLVDEAERVVERASGVVDGVGPDSVGAVTGRLADTAEVPVRLEFDVAVGVPSDEPTLDDVLSVRGLEREADAVRGRIHVDGTDRVDDVTMVLLWFDDDGDVVAAVPQPVEQVRPDVEVRFEIDLADEVVPEGRPDSVVWTT